MKAKKVKKRSRKNLKSSLKAATASAVLAGSLLVSTPSTAAARVNERAGSIQERVNAVRTLLELKLAADDSAASKLSYSEMELTQWGNWGNWGNWNNWKNWNNWNNWGNWANWGNR